jgi:hypothetical protein
MHATIEFITSRISSLQYKISRIRGYVYLLFLMSMKHGFPHWGNNINVRAFYNMILKKIYVTKRRLDRKLDKEKLYICALVAVVKHSIGRYFCLQFFETNIGQGVKLRPLRPTSFQFAVHYNCLTVYHPTLYKLSSSYGVIKYLNK